MLLPHEEHGLKEWAALYALGALTQEERTSFEHHLGTGCSICQAEVRALEHIANQMVLATCQDPPASLRAMILSRIPKEGANAPQSEQSVLLRQNGIFISLDYGSQVHGRRLTSIELGINEERVAVSDHIAYFWETEQQFKDAIGFLEIGLRGEDTCVVFGHPPANDKVLSLLAADGFDSQRLQQQGRLAVLGGKTSGTEMLNEIGNTFQKAVAAGAPLIRLLGNIGWGHPDWPSEPDILEFEAKVTAACRNFPCVIVCMYDVSQLSGRIMVHGAYETHPLTICGNVLRENSYCVSTS